MKNRFGRTDDTEDIPMWRWFGRRRYRRVAVCSGEDAHQSAKDEADRRRSMLDYARIVRCSKGRWAVYASE